MSRILTKAQRERAVNESKEILDLLKVIVSSDQRKDLVEEVELGSYGYEKLVLTSVGLVIKKDEPSTDFYLSRPERNQVNPALHLVVKFQMTKENLLALREELTAP
jgi:hypothetical protein